MQSRGHLATDSCRVLYTASPQSLPVPRSVMLSHCTTPTWVITEQSGKALWLSVREEELMTFKYDTILRVDVDRQPERQPRKKYDPNDA